MAKFGDEKGKRLGSDAGRERIAERRARTSEIMGKPAGTEAEPGTSQPPEPEQDTSKKPSARKRSR